MHPHRNLSVLLAHMNKTCLALACFFALPTFAAAQTAAPDSPRWSLGAGIGLTDSPYAGEGTKVTPLPLLRYEGDRFFFRGLTGGAHLFSNSAFSLDAIASLRMDGIDAKDFGRQELARNGINRNLLKNRDNGLDLGLVASWRSSVGEFELTAKADASGASEGYELEAKYGYEFEIGRGSLTPGISVSYLSKDMANYYYGTLKEEVARGVVNYKPGAATIPKLGVTYMHPIGQDWRFMSALQYKFLPSKISDSPLLESKPKGETSIIFGLTRSF